MSDTTSGAAPMVALLLLALAALAALIASQRAEIQRYLKVRAM